MSKIWKFDIFHKNNFQAALYSPTQKLSDDLTLQRLLNYILLDWTWCDFDMFRRDLSDATKCFLLNSSCHLHKNLVFMSICFEFQTTSQFLC